MKSILDPSFRYVKAAETTVDYLRERFKYHRERIDKQMKEQETKIKPLIRVKHGTR